jgi:hypothetical protein
LITQDNATNSEQFPNVARRILGEVQVAVAELIAAVPVEGKSIRRAASLQRALGIDRKLAWQIFKLTTVDDPVAAGLLIPRKMSVAKVLQHARDRALPTEVLTRATDSFAAYDQLVARTAGDREVFDSMLSGIARDGTDPLDLFHKRAAVRAATHFLGVHAEAMLKTWIFHPSADGIHFDTVNLSALVGLKRLRLGAPLMIARPRLATDDGVPAAARRMPLDEAAAEKYGINLLEAFSTSPIPTFELRQTKDGATDVLLTGGQLGQASASTCVVGDYQRAVFTRFRTPGNLTASIGSLIRTPCERLIYDMVVAQGTFGPIQPSVKVYSDHDGESRFTAGTVLGVRETVRLIASGLRGINLPEVPNYSKIMAYTLDKLGWRADDFEVYRCIVDYPILPSSVAIVFDLNDPP